MSDGITSLTINKLPLFNIFRFHNRAEKMLSTHINQFALDDRTHVD